jgi:hypothetical protein
VSADLEELRRLAATHADPWHIAMEIVCHFSWDTNVVHEGRLVGQQHVVALAIRDAIQAEREASESALAAEREKVGRLTSALGIAAGYMTNAAIDLQTDAPKKTALATLNGGIETVRRARSAIKEATDG